ncbi:MAG: restriction endonuclease, partial [Clostridia bacterium]|nr:restriction endonuclease [Clostridia bacterium]
REDYDAMAGQLARSMVAPAQREDDIPERPVFTNISSSDTDEDEDELPAEEERPAKTDTKRKPLAPPVKPAPVPTYRPSYVPPAPTVRPVVKKTPVRIDPSKVHTGSTVSHKAFGPGQVKGIDGGYIEVAFAAVNKKFPFPGAFDQGFLKLDAD